MVLESCRVSPPAHKVGAARRRSPRSGRSRGPSSPAGWGRAVWTTCRTIGSTPARAVRPRATAGTTREPGATRRPRVAAAPEAAGSGGAAADPADPEEVRADSSGGHARVTRSAGRPASGALRHRPVSLAAGRHRAGCARSSVAAPMAATSAVATRPTWGRSPSAGRSAPPERRALRFASRGVSSARSKPRRLTRRSATGGRISHAAQRTR